MVVESLLDLTFSLLPVTVVCPYDERVVGPGIIAEAIRVHPHIRTSTEVVHNDDYGDPLTTILEIPADAK